MGRPKGLKTESSADLFYLWIVAFAFVAVAIGAAITPAKASKPVCFSPELVRQVMKEKMPGPMVIEQKGKEAKAAIDRFNNAGKPTSYVGDYILLWVAPGRPPFQVVIFNKGCAVVRCLYGMGCKTVPKSAGIKPEEIMV